MNDFDFIQTSAREIQQEIIETLENEIGETLYPGDERRIFANALVLVMTVLFNKVNDACRQKLLRFARGEALEEYGEMNGATRTEGKKASVIVRFCTTEPVEEDIIIPSGTRVTADFEKYYIVKDDTVIKSGYTSVDCQCEAEKNGEEYNGTGIGNIKILVDQIPFIDSVSNITVPDGGADLEEDEKYREQIRKRRAAFSTAGPEKAYQYYAFLADPSIIDVAVISPSAGCVKVIPMCEEGKLPTEEILTKVRAALNDESVRPLTDNVIVEAPETVTYDIELTYYTTASNESRCVSAVEGDDGAIKRYIKWQQSAMGKAINPDYLRKLILSPDWGETLVGADRVVLKAPEYTEIGKQQVPMIGNITVNHIVEG